MKWLARAASALREAAEPVMILAGNQLANGHSKKMQGQNVISCYAIVIAMKKVPIFANEVRFPPVYVHQIDLWSCLTKTMNITCWKRIFNFANKVSFSFAMSLDWFYK